MAALPVPRKRSGPALCGDSAAAAAPPALRSGLPPHKRPKSAVTGIVDPFGDSDEFTADDLEQIDILASQALSQDPPAGHAWGAPELPRAGRQGSRTEDGLMRDAFQFEVLQAQHEEVKQKLKEMQDEILTKNGEIKILRDSMQQMECAMEEQKKSYLLLEQQKIQILSEKEKEFSKKLQSLHSELQFKDAEMNELRTRLQNCERNKHLSQAVPATSPKKNLIQVKSEGCSPQPGRRSFPTKESFNAEMSTRPSCSSGNLMALTVSIKEDRKITHPEVSSLKQQKATGKNSSCNSVPKQNTQGSILLNALMKQPIVPGSFLGLCHLLSSNSEPLPGAVLPPNSLDTKATQLPSSRTTQEGMASLVSLQEAQKLAITGLNLIALDEGLSEGSPAGQGRFLPLTQSRIQGAVHLLPLVEHHIGAFCQAEQLGDTPGNGACGTHPAAASRASTNTVSSKEDFRSSLEETTLVSLGILYYLVFYSWDVVHTLLSAEMDKSSAAGDEQVSKMDKNGLCDNQCDKKEESRTQGGLLAPQDHSNTDGAQHSLFKKLLQILAFSAARGSQTDNILSQSLKVLVKLAENSTMDLLINFQHLLSSQVLQRCLRPETPLPAVLLTVRLLCALAQHHLLVAQLCSHSDTCLLLALYMYITSRPDKSAPEMLWLQLEQETVRLLTRCMWCSRPAVLFPGTDCQCNLEVVKALIVMLHRQWMKIRSETSLCAHKEQVIQFLRDAVLLLHSLSQKDKLFHEHCLEVLHQYDQAMPSVRAILKKTEKLSASEELILDELYPPEPEDQGTDSS
ncbi:ATR-interacting protein isoform X2 [Oenanthe melanoleuca]|uniref:ATR-interacting protein isoform X2 n=1 Tax=Oenanthe melanoleuca TaxID=2939378 RepID=UPI0024C11B55|nr:ATR-interacting protein isoform X2 [Oenanthe melanoleuca]